MSITNLDKATIKAIRADVNAALKEVAEKYGMAISAGDASYNTQTATFKLVCAVGADPSDNATLGQYNVELKKIHPLLFPTLSLDARYRVGSGVYEIVGYNSQARKHPMLLRNIANNKVAKAPIAELLKAEVVNGSSTGNRN